MISYEEIYRLSHLNEDSTNMDIIRKIVSSIVSKLGSKAVHDQNEILNYIYEELPSLTLEDNSDDSSEEPHSNPEWDKVWEEKREFILKHFGEEKVPERISKINTKDSIWELYHLLQENDELRERKKRIGSEVISERNKESKEFSTLKKNFENVVHFFIDSCFDYSLGEKLNYGVNYQSMGDEEHGKVLHDDSTLSDMFNFSAIQSKVNSQNIEAILSSPNGEEFIKIKPEDTWIYNHPNTYMNSDISKAFFEVFNEYFEKKKNEAQKGAENHAKNEGEEKVKEFFKSIINEHFDQNNNLDLDFKKDILTRISAEVKSSSDVFDFYKDPSLATSELPFSQDTLTIFENLFNLCLREKKESAEVIMNDLQAKNNELVREYNNLLNDENLNKLDKNTRETIRGILRGIGIGLKAISLIVGIASAMYMWCIPGGDALLAPIAKLNRGLAVGSQLLLNRTSPNYRSPKRSDSNYAITSNGGGDSGRSMSTN